MLKKNSASIMKLVSILFPVIKRNILITETQNVVGEKKRQTNNRGNRELF